MPDESHHKSWRDEQTDELCRAFLKIKDISSMYDFLEDLATISEIKSMAQRLEVAKLLNMSKKYPEVASLTGASTATISRVKRCLEYGTGGYKSVLQE